MSRSSDELREQANSAREMAGVMSRRDMRDAALDIAKGCDRQADAAEYHETGD